MSEIPKAYDPKAVEDKWYQAWLDNQFFIANPASTKPAYSIVIPPPNVTGVLHMGHVLNNTIQDILSRKARMEGKEVLWLPGTDHAGISTQTMVEKTLRKEGKMRHRDDLGREKFLEHVWTWKKRHGDIIIQQLKKLGCSCDWSRERFTMDPDYIAAVQKAFVELYRDGLIYRGKRMVNWDPSARTALSDEEVDMVEQKSHLWFLKYPLLNGAGKSTEADFVVVATTRPETMLGDEAVAVNPKDERYNNLVGRRCLLPLQNKPIPIIADDFVDPKFGTGCVKVTPAHDPNDYEIGLRHQLPVTSVIGPDGKMTNVAGSGFAGLDRVEARKAVVEKLTEQNLVLKVEDYVHSVGLSQRTQVPIEPYLSEQWFMRYPCVEEATKAVEQGRIQFHPERWTKTYTHWMNKLKDWCISRQLWWGHRVPVWRPGPNSTAAQQTEARSFLAESAKTNLIVLRDLEPTQEHPEKTWEVAIGPGLNNVEARLTELGFVQETDVLDTWASSWLWPFATMGWPKTTETLQKFYPTTDLVTAPDIIFFWVARMIMAGFRFMGDLPFHNVYFTGLIRDKQGRKMSKTLGNSPDPLELIANYGADALRFGTMRSAPLGQDILFDEKDVELGRNFCNKLWNACRFRQMQAGEVQAEISPQLLTPDDKWILLKLDQAIREITSAFDEYRFNEAVHTLYRFFWSEFCDWYLEATKAVVGAAGGTAGSAVSTQPDRRANTLAVIDFVLSHTLRLFHPFLPFITEELWHGMGYNQDMPEAQGGKSILFAPWPKPLDEDFRGHYGLDDCYLEMVDARYALVTLGRNLRREHHLPANKKAHFVFRPTQFVAPQEAEVIKLLLNAEKLEMPAEYQPPKGTPSVSSPLGDLFLILEAGGDTEAEKARLKKELAKIEAEISKGEQKMNNPSFREKAPPAVLAEHQRRLAEWSEKRAQALSKLASLEGGA